MAAAGNLPLRRRPRSSAARSYAPRTGGSHTFYSNFSSAKQAPSAAARLVTLEVAAFAIDLPPRQCSPVAGEVGC